MEAGRRSEARALATALLAYLGLSLLVTWPLPSDPARLTIPNPDTYLNTWAMAWVAHQGVRDPAHLYEANIYHPLPLALAYTETLLPQSLQGLPVRLLGGGPLLAHNLVLLATFPLAGLGAYLLARDFRASPFGAFLAGLGFGFGAFRNEHLVHLQTLSHAWLPFALLALRHALRAPRPASLLALATFSVLQALSSGYYAVASALGLGATLVHEYWASRARSMLRVIAVLAASAVLCVLLLLPQVLVQQGHAFRRSRAECAGWSARWASFLDPGAHAALPQQRWLAGLFPTGEPLYPGLAILALAAMGLPLVRRSPEARLAALLAATGVIFSLGPDIRLGPWTLTGPYELIRLAPGGGSLRTPVRLAVLGLLGLGLLAGLAWTELVSRRRGAPWLAAGLTLLTAAEARPADLARSVRPAPQVSAAVRVLADQPRGAVLELPWNEWEEAALYMYWSTEHWQPLVNGFGAFQPPGFRMVGLLGRRWPSAHASRVLRARGIRYVVVHLDRVTPRQRERILEETLPEGVRLLSAEGEDRVWEIAPLGQGTPLK